MRLNTPYLYFSLLGACIAATTYTVLHLYFATDSVHAFFIGTNVASFIVMGLDKSLARSSSPRTPETLLYILALLGGAPGVLIGCQIFKHKTRKAAFQLTLLLIFGVQLYLLQVLGVSFR